MSEQIRRSAATIPRLPREPWRGGNSGRGTWRARGPRRAGGLSGLAARTLHRQRRHSGRWWIAALRVLSAAPSLIPLAPRQRAFGAAGVSFSAADAGGRGSSGQSGRGLAPRRSSGTWQLSTRCSSDALSERRSFNVRASCATAKDPAAANTSIAAVNLFMLKAPCGKSD